jgi:MFS transporter, FHS family, glucose/mannose:H+ symporter
MYRRNLVFAAACLGMLLFGIVFLSLGSVNNMLAHRFQLDNNQIGTLTALLPLGILVGSLVFGPIVDRFGYKWLLIICAAVVMTALEGLAFAGSTGAVQFYVFLIGLGGGGLNGATNALTADVSEGERGAKLSLLGVFFGIGALGMPSVLAVLSRHYSLNSIVAGIGLFVLLPIAFFSIIRFPPPKQAESKGQVFAGLSMLRHPILLFSGLALAIQSGMEGMSNDWMTRYFRNVVLVQDQAPEWQALLALMAVTGALVVSRLILSWLLKRVESVYVLFASILITAAGALLLMAAPRYEVALAAALLIGAGLAAAFPVVLSYIGDLYPSQSGAAFSAIFFLALLGNMTINKTFGIVAHAYGVHQYTTLMLVCLAFSAVLLFLVARQRSKHNARNGGGKPSAPQYQNLAKS